MKKTNKENPVTFFRKANEARKKVVKASLKKAQDGIETNDDMINKPGSTGGYKKPTSNMLNSYKQKLANDQYTESVKTSRDNLRKAYDDYLQKNITNKQKKGGSVKTKKK